MSNDVMRAFRTLQMPPSPKATGMCLADSASDGGSVWEDMSVALICRWTCLSKDSVLRSLKWLEDHGLLRVVRRDGRRHEMALDLSAIESMNQSQRATGDQSHHATAATSRTVQPVAPCDETGSTMQPEPVAPCDPITKEPSYQETKRDQRSAPKRRITGDWQPDGKLKAWAQQVQPEIDLAKVVENFRDYHLGKGEARASWDASFRTWIRNEITFAAKPRPARRPTSHSGFDKLDYRQGIGPNGELQ
jgi:hypothetical protein